jgi:hypothetical protein
MAKNTKKEWTWKGVHSFLKNGGGYMRRLYYHKIKKDRFKKERKKSELGNRCGHYCSCGVCGIGEYTDD